MICQSLQAVAAYLRFDWNAPEPFRELFRRACSTSGASSTARTTSRAWYTSRARFDSQIPLEYAYAAWGELPTAERRRARRVRALPGRRRRTCSRASRRGGWRRWSTSPSDFTGNRQTAKTPFDLPDLADFEDKARDAGRTRWTSSSPSSGTSSWATGRRPGTPRPSAGCCWARRCSCATSRPTRSRAWPSRTARTSAGGCCASSTGRRIARRIPSEAGPADRRSSATSATGRRRACACGCGSRRTGVDCDLDEALALSTLREGDRLVLCPRLDRGRAPAGRRAGRVHADARSRCSTATRSTLDADRAVERDADGPGRRRRVPRWRLNGRRSAAAVARLTSSAAIEPRRSSPDAALHARPRPERLVRLLVREGRRGAAEPASRTRSTTGSTTREPAHADWPHEAVGRAGALPGRAGRVPRRRALLHDFEPSKRELHRRARRRRRSAGAGAARHRQELLHRLRPVRPDPGGDGGRARRSGSSCPARRTRPPTCCWRTSSSVQEKLRGLAADAPGDLRARTSTRACSTCRCSGWRRAEPPPDGVDRAAQGRREGRAATPRTPTRSWTQRVVRRRGDARRDLRHVKEQVAEGHLRPRALRLPGAGRGLPDEPARGDRWRRCR